MLVFLVVPLATPRSNKEAPPESSSSSEDTQDDDSGSKASSAEDSDPDDGLPRNCDIAQLPGGRSVQTKGRRRFVNWVNSQAARLDKTKPFNWNFTPLHFIYVSNNYIFFFSFFFFSVASEKACTASALFTRTCTRSCKCTFFFFRVFACVLYLFFVSFSTISFYAFVHNPFFQLLLEYTPGERTSTGASTARTAKSAKPGSKARASSTSRRRRRQRRRHRRKKKRKRKRKRKKKKENAWSRTRGPRVERYPPHTLTDNI